MDWLECHMKGPLMDNILENYLNELFGKKIEKKFILIVIRAILYNVSNWTQHETIKDNIKFYGCGVSFKDLTINEKQKIKFFKQLGEYYKISFTENQIRNISTLCEVIKLLNSKNIKD